MLGIKHGEITGILPVNVVYELVLHWLRNKFPVFRNIEEMKTFTSMYFKVADLKLGDYVESAKIKSRRRRDAEKQPGAKREDIESNRFNHTVDGNKAPCTNSDWRWRYSMGSEEKGSGSYMVIHRS